MNGANPVSRVIAVLRGLLRAGFLSQFLFWSWNALFVVFVYAGVAPLIAWPLAKEALDGFIPPSFLAALLVMLAVPALSLVLGLWRLRRDPTRLFALFYGFEAPVFVLALLRIFLVRQMTPALGVWLALFLIAVTSLLVGALRKERPVGIIASHATLAGETLGFAVGLQVAALIALFALPMGWAILRSVFDLSFLEPLSHLFGRGIGLRDLILGAGLLALFGYSATLFVGLPLAFVAVHVARFRSGLMAFAARHGYPRAAALVGVALVGAAGAVAATAPQHQEVATAIASSSPASDAERIERLSRSALVRSGLVNAYLSPYRYLDDTADPDGINGLYREAFRLAERPEWPQRLLAVLASPVFYRNSGTAPEQRRDRAHIEAAARDYAAFFDRPIQRAEQAEILGALEATYEASAREAGLVDTGERKVHLDKQDIEVHPRGEVAEIEIHEVYVNRTQEEQELFYYFSLPPTAVVTGLHLGDTEERGRRFPFQVSPRGAAQKIYREQLARRVDPALIEQVGPAQYRLRAFPVPPRGRDWTAGDGGGERKESPRLHLWLRYEVLAEGDHYPLPVLAEKRNVFWDRRTVRSVNGAQVRTADDDDWLPAPPASTGEGGNAGHEVRFADGKVVRIERDRTPLDRSTPRGRRIAVVVDRSRSMGEQREALIGAFDWLAKRVVPGNEVDVCLTSPPRYGEAPRRVSAAGFDASRIVFYGGQDPADLLRQYQASCAGPHQAVIILTDGSGPDMAGALEPPQAAGAAKPSDLSIGAQVLFVHLGGVFPTAYDDATLQAIQRSGGGAFGSVAEGVSAMARFEPGSYLLSRSAGYRFTLETADPAQAASPTPATDPFQRIAARALIESRVRDLKSAAGTTAEGLAELDALHALARAAGIVTPYSSMIVLVNDEQRKALARAESEADRFQREAESGSKALPSPAFAGNVTGTPEPAEWMLLCAGLGALAKRRRARTRAAAPAAA